MQSKRVCKLILIIIASFTVSCTITNKILDVFIFPSTDYYEQVNDDPNAIAICSRLEAKGYQFESFDVGEYGVEITYSNGKTRQFIQSYSVNPIVVTSIHRDFNNPDLISDAEFTRLQEQAQVFCHDYQKIASESEGAPSLSGVFYWDYIVGVRGGFSFTDTCEIANSYGWSAGSYASRYETDASLTCPSGKVQQ